MELENLNPNLRLLLELKFNLEQGRSVNLGLKAYREKYQDEISEFVMRWEALRSGDFTVQVESLPGFQNLRPTTRNLLILAERGLRGESILGALREYEVEIVQMLTSEVDEQVARLPIAMSLPLIGLIFPAFMLLLAGSFVLDLLNGLS